MWLLVNILEANCNNVLSNNNFNINSNDESCCKLCIIINNLLNLIILIYCLLFTKVTLIILRHVIVNQNNCTSFVRILVNIMKVSQFDLLMIAVICHGN